MRDNSGLVQLSLLSNSLMAPYQVNNAAAPAHTASLAPENEKSQKKLSEEQDDERLDTGAAR